MPQNTRISSSCLTSMVPGDQPLYHSTSFCPPQCLVTSILLSTTKINISIKHIWARLHDYSLCGPNLLHLMGNAPQSLTGASVSLSARQADSSNCVSCKSNQLRHYSPGNSVWPHGGTPSLQISGKHAGSFHSSNRQAVGRGSYKPGIILSEQLPELGEAHLL